MSINSYGNLLKAGKSFILSSKTLPKTGTKVFWVRDKLGNLINKTVLPGSGNSVSKSINSFTSTFVQDKPAMLSIGLKDAVVALAKNLETGKWKAHDHVMLDNNVKKINGALVQLYNGQNGNEILKIKDKLGNLVSKIIFPQTGVKNTSVTAITANYAQGKPVQSAVIQNNIALTFKKSLNSPKMEKMDFIRYGDLG